jgi:hypothetical protein
MVAERMVEEKSLMTAASAAYLNQGVQLTASSLRYATASGSGSGLALDADPPILSTPLLV